MGAREGRRRIILAMAGAAVAPRVAAQADRAFKIGVLSVGTAPGSPGRWQTLMDALAGLGYAEGRNVEYLWAFGGGNFSLMPAQLAEFLNAGVDVIVATGTREIRAAMQATRTIPIVMTLAADPVKEGFIKSLARPGGNVTGLTSLVPGLAQKYVQLLREVVPAAKKFAVVAVAPNPVPAIRQEFIQAAQKLGMQLPVVQFQAVADFERVLAQASKDGVQGLIHPLDGATSPHRSALAQAAIKAGLPGIFWDVAYVEAGGLMTYSVSFPEQLRAAARYVDQLLRGAKPAELPVQLPARVELVLNRKTSQALGIPIPPSLAVRADRIID